MSLRLCARLALALAMLLPACTRAQEPQAGALPAGSSATAVAAVVPASLSSGAAAPAAPVDSPRLLDPRWQRAAEDEDPAARQALADALGATGLVAALADGGAIARTALATLPSADDADLALGPLARRAREEQTARSEQGLEATLTAILGIAGRPATAREALDPEGAAEAGEALLTIASDKALARELRALAISAARALSEKRIVDPARIPGDLDPPEQFGREGTALRYPRAICWRGARRRARWMRHVGGDAEARQWLAEMRRALSGATGRQS